jgi:hypothetical protein
MAGQALDGVAEVWDDWQGAVNMTAKELEDFLGSDESKSVGDKSSGGESTGHASGQRIVEIQRTKKADLTDDDAAHMRKVVGYVHRHLAQRPSGDVSDTAWRYSLMNWGHDPTKYGPERMAITLGSSGGANRTPARRSALLSRGRAHTTSTGDCQRSAFSSWRARWPRLTTAGTTSWRP